MTDAEKRVADAEKRVEDAAKDAEIRIKEAESRTEKFETRTEKAETALRENREPLQNTWDNWDPSSSVSTFTSHGPSSRRISMRGGDNTKKHLQEVTGKRALKASVTLTILLLIPFPQAMS